MRQLITFLGRAQTTYRTAVYRFHGENLPESRFFGLALARRLDPGRLIVLGTAGSMWDALLSDLLQSEPTSEHYALMDAANAGTVSARHLGLVRPLIEQAIGGIPVQLQLISRAETFGEQMSILRTLAEAVAEGDEVHIDVTHGFRHLPMLGLAAARFLQRVRKAQVRGIYYGALDMTQDGITPVLELDGLAHLLGWVESLAAYDASADAGALADSLAGDGLSAGAVGKLRKAASSARNLDVEPAARSLRQLLDEFHHLPSPAVELFEPELRDRLAWTSKGERWQREWALAEQYLKRRDYVRAALLTSEAIVTRACQEYGRDPSARAQRDEARSRLHNNPAFGRLAHIRNAFAHANSDQDTAANRRAADLIKDPEKLDKALHQLQRELATASLPIVQAAANPS